VNKGAIGTIDSVGVTEYDFRKIGNAKATATPKAIIASTSEAMATIKGVLDGFWFSSSMLMTSSRD
jgi:hypothetical protein